MIEDRCFWKWFICNYSLHRLYLTNFFRLLHPRDALCKEIESDRREVGTNPISITLTNQSHSDILDDIIKAINIIALCLIFSEKVLSDICKSNAEVLTSVMDLVRKCLQETIYIFAQNFYVHLLISPLFDNFGFGREQLRGLCMQYFVWNNYIIITY